LAGIVFAAATAGALRLRFPRRSQSFQCRAHLSRRDLDPFGGESCNDVARARFFAKLPGGFSNGLSLGHVLLLVRTASGLLLIDRLVYRALASRLARSTSRDLGFLFRALPDAGSFRDASLFSHGDALS
jgi:hypothetical protein